LFPKYFNTVTRFPSITAFNLLTSELHAPVDFVADAEIFKLPFFCGETCNSDSDMGINTCHLAYIIVFKVAAGSHQ
jgi:hypothetical protein